MAEMLARLSIRAVSAPSHEGNQLVQSAQHRAGIECWMPAIRHAGATPTQTRLDVCGGRARARARGCLCIIPKCTARHSLVNTTCDHHMGISGWAMHHRRTFSDKSPVTITYKCLAVIDHALTDFIAVRYIMPNAAQHHHYHQGTITSILLLPAATARHLCVIATGD